MDIRKTVVGDLDAFYELYCEVCAEGEFSTRRTPPPKDLVGAALARVERQDWPHYVVDRDGEIVASGEVFPETLCHNGGDPGIGVLGIQVRKSCRGQGLGSLLMGCLIDHSRRTGFRRLELQVLKGNAAAIRLYTRFGFDWVEDLAFYTLPSGRRDQLQRMRLPLTE